MAKHAKEDFCKAGKGVEPDHYGCIEYPVDELDEWNGRDSARGDQECGE